jgi:S1-C subfamily serine protease
VHASLPDSVARIRQSIAIVGTYRATDAPRFRLRGTGCVVGPGNLVVTNFHVLPPAAEATSDVSLMVQVRSGAAAQELSMRQATVLDTSRTHDLALLRIEGQPVPPVVLGNSDAVREGQAIAFMGFPIGGTLGFTPVTHRGIVSSITPAVLPAPNAGQLSDAAIRGVRAGAFDIFQLDATAYPGNSGGPVIDLRTGLVVGVVSLALVKGTREAAISSPTGISYAVPVQQLAGMLPAR